MEIIKKIIILIFIVILFILFFREVENFIIDSPSHKNLTSAKANQYTPQIKNDGQNGYAFLGTSKKELARDVSFDLNVVVAYNDDIKYEKPRIVDPNIDIDKGVTDVLIKIKNKKLTVNLPLIDSLPANQIEKEISIGETNNNEIMVITDSFITYINSITNRKFNKTGGETIASKKIWILPSKQGELRKRYDIALFINESNIDYTKRVSLTAITNQFISKPGYITLESVTSPGSDSVAEVVLPGLIEPIKVNTISGDSISGVYYKILNKLGLTAPYKTSENEMLITKKDFDLEEERRKKVKKLKEEYACYNTRQGEQIKSAIECEKYGGKWDREVGNDGGDGNDDEFCPFYLANKNYPNKEGGSKGGYCTMVSGVQNVGFRYYDENPEKFKPLCYNCKTDLIGQGTLGTCCNKQKDALEYPTLKTPDYKFPGDAQDRYNSRYDLEKRKLSYK